MKDDYDGAEPSGNSVALLNLLRLAHFTDRADYREAAERTLRALGAKDHRSSRWLCRRCWWASIITLRRAAKS